MVADTRVTWLTRQHTITKSKDALKKLYAIRSSKKATVLGFSGDIEAAKKIIIYLGKHKFGKFFVYNRPLIMANLKDDLRRWMEEAAELYPEVWGKIKFMLCGIEPSRHPPLMKEGKVIGHTPFVEHHIYTYEITKEGNVFVNMKRVDFDVIGAGEELDKKIREKVKRTFRFANGAPELRWARAVVLCEEIAQIVKENEEVSTKVGGPFQVVRITPDRLEDHWIWPPDEGDRNVEVHQAQGGITVISNPLLEKKYLLYPIWKFPFK